MKKAYIKPVIEEVNTRLLNVVLGPGIGDWSNGASGEFADAKERENLEDEEEEAVMAQQQNYSLW